MTTPDPLEGIRLPFSVVFEPRYMTAELRVDIGTRNHSGPDADRVVHLAPGVSTIMLSYDGGAEVTIEVNKNVLGGGEWVRLSTLSSGIDGETRSTPGIQVATSYTAGLRASISPAPNANTVALRRAGLTVYPLAPYSP